MSILKVIGLTGGIGSGKSTIASIFKTLGVHVYNSDQRAKELYLDSGIKKQVIDLLGKEAYSDKNNLNKKYVSTKIFSDKTLLAKINAIIHPAVKKDFEEFKKTHSAEKYIVKESALLIEVGLQKTIDKLIVVISDTNLRLKRIKKRDTVTEKEIETIMRNQLPDKEKIKQADWVIENNEIDLLIPQVLRIHKSLLH